MQIILVQTEVVQALRDYVASRLTLAEGTEITVDLSATRGANGVTATIDLVEPGQKAAPVTQQVIGKPAAKPETPVKVTEAAQATQVTQPAAAVQEQPAATAAEANPAADVQQADETGAGVQAATSGDKPADGTKSLFGNLNRPKNN